jgi:hypothetical protein
MNKILTIDFEVYGFRVAFFIPAYLKEQIRKKVKKISTYIYKRRNR